MNVGAYRDHNREIMAIYDITLHIVIEAVNISIVQYNINFYYIWRKIEKYQQNLISDSMTNIVIQVRRRKK